MYRRERSTAGDWRAFRSARVLVLVATMLTVLSVAPVPGMAAEDVSTTLVSVASGGTPANSFSNSAEISGDGSVVVFISDASNLVPGDSNGFRDVFMRKLTTGETVRISQAPDGTGGNGNSFSPSISADGSKIVYFSEATNLVPGDTVLADVFLYDVDTGITTRVSETSDGQAANNHSSNPSISADGSVVVYESGATNLVPGMEDDLKTNIFRYDVGTKETTLISATPATDHHPGSFNPDVSGDGNLIVFESYAWNFVPGDFPNDLYDVFLYDVTSGEYTRVSEAPDGTEAYDVSQWAVISDDGSAVAYESLAPNLVADDTNDTWDVFHYDIANDVTTRVSVASDGSEANDASSGASISADGALVAFESNASNLVAGDSGTFNDVFAHDMGTGETVRLSVTADGSTPNGGSFDPAIAADGSTVSYYSSSSDLVAGDTNGVADVFVATIGTAPSPGPGPSTFQDIDGSVFASDIEWLADANITRGCNPPTNDMFCPDGAVTRGQMAAFLVRALQLTDDGGGNHFVDDDGSVFESDIAKLAAANITRGCNPPTNDMFCPNGAVTRGQMAAFLHRALGG